jgi:hypothetical protein
MDTSGEPDYRRLVARVLGLLVAIVICAGLVTAADASAAVTRIRVDWTGANGQEYSPYVNASNGQYAGPCARRPGDCNAAPGFHWEEADFSASGFAHTISYVDDQPEQQRLVCFEVQHPFDPSIPSGGQITGTATITDADGTTTRSVPFAIDKGQRVNLGCSPAMTGSVPTQPTVGRPGSATANTCPDDPTAPAPPGVVRGPRGTSAARLVGTALRDQLTGGPGDDTLLGLGARDCLTGNAGRDRLAGGDGSDILFGGDGDDVLEGGAGIDAMDGGAGNDVLVAGPEGATAGQVNCGPGDDIAIAPAIAQLTDCETRLAAAPTAKSVDGSVVSGTVRVRFPGSGRFVVLAKAQPIPYGAVVDTQRGRVRIVASHGADGIQVGDFYDGVFVLVRANGPAPLTEAALTGSLTRCGRGARAAKAPKHGRRLWGDGKGRFRTRGRRSAATVTGTTWSVEDRCDGTTLTRVKQGTVSVRDFARRRTVVLRAGQRYVAGRRRR